MIINRTHGFIFIHVPKCGGTAATVDLSPLTGIGDVEIGSTPFGGQIAEAYAKRYGLSKHSTAAFVGAQIPDLWRQSFTFAFVRNPFDRAVSTFRFLKRWQGWKDREWIDGCYTVNEFIAHEKWLEPTANKILERQIFFTGHGTKWQVDKTFQAEDYKASILAIYRYAKTEFVDAIKGFRNKSPRVLDPMTLWLNNASIKRIRERYADDFEALGYSTEPIIEPPVTWEMA